MRNQFAFDAQLQRAGFLWDCVAASQEIGHGVASAHYVAITRSDGGAFTRFSDGEDVRIESEDEARMSIGREPVCILFGKRGPASVGDELVQTPIQNTNRLPQTMCSFARGGAARPPRSTQRKELPPSRRLYRSAGRGGGRSPLLL